MSLNITHGIEFESGERKISVSVNRAETITFEGRASGADLKHAASFGGNIEPVAAYIELDKAVVPAKALLNYTDFLRGIGELTDEMSIIMSITRRSPTWIIERIQNTPASTGGVEEVGDHFRILFAIASRPNDLLPSQLSHIAAAIADSQCLGEVTSVEGVKALAPVTLEILRGLINDIEGLGDELFEPTSVPAFVAENFRKYQKAL